LKKYLDSIWSFLAITVVGYLFYEFQRGQRALKQVKIQKIETKLGEIDNEVEKKDLDDLVRSDNLNRRKREGRR
jgi:hypothetical protein